jgi:lysozyme family protein
MTVSISRNHIINEIIRVEGGYVNDPRDSGGETNFGITVAVARGHGYYGPMVDMPRKVAFDIYAAKYWDAVRGDQLVELSEAVAEEVVDTSVNMGPGRAGKFLQRALNALNNEAKLYADLKVDGAIGPATLSALAAYLLQRDEMVLSRALNCLQGAFYVELAERREKDERFVYGWLKNRVVI